MHKKIVKEIESYRFTQCPAVTTCWSLIRDPPQRLFPIRMYACNRKIEIFGPLKLADKSTEGVSYSAVGLATYRPEKTGLSILLIRPWLSLC